MNIFSLHMFRLHIWSYTELLLQGRVKCLKLLDEDSYSVCLLDWLKKVIQVASKPPSKNKGKLMGLPKDSTLWKYDDITAEYEKKFSKQEVSFHFRSKFDRLYKAIPHVYVSVCLISVKIFFFCILKENCYELPGSAVYSFISYWKSLHLWNIASLRLYYLLYVGLGF